jgi:predicted dehydrogenase
MNHDPGHSTTRRDFVKTSSAAALGGALVAQLGFPSITSGASNSDKLKIGLIGCGGRGTGAANQALNADSNVELHAMGDVFESQLVKSLTALQKQARPEKISVAEDRRFVGLDAYQKVLASGVDVVILTTPPGFRPTHFKAAIDAGKHVFLEKPVATDAPGLRSVMASVQEAKRKQLSVVPGFMYRNDVICREFMQQIHDGAIGDMRALYGSFFTGPVKPMQPPESRPAGMGDVEWQLRNWYNFTWICGDGLVEQAVHSVDKMAWVMRDVMPLKAVAVGGRQTPNYEGNIYDHVEVNYEFPGEVRGFLVHRQISNCFGGVRDYYMGSKGIGTIGGRRTPGEITGEKSWRYAGPPAPDMYQVEHDELFAGIRAGAPINNGDRMCTSTLMAIMGRMAAYTGQEITWEQALNSQEKLAPDSMSWDMKLPILPMAVPGKTKFL